MPSESESADTINRITLEIARLSAEQSSALEYAAYFGMSREESKRFDERLKQIAELVQELQNVRKPLTRSNTAQIIPFPIKAVDTYAYRGGDAGNE